MDKTVGSSGLMDEIGRTARASGIDSLSKVYKVAVTRTDPLKEQMRVERIRRDYVAYAQYETTNMIIIPGLQYGVSWDYLPFVLLLINAADKRMAGERAAQKQKKSLFAPGKKKQDESQPAEADLEKTVKTAGIGARDLVGAAFYRVGLDSRLGEHFGGRFTRVKNLFNEYAQEASELAATLNEKLKLYEFSRDDEIVGILKGGFNAVCWVGYEEWLLATSEGWKLE